MQDQSPHPRTGYSRRDFLRGTAAATAATAAVLSEQESAEAAAATKVAAAQPQEITLSVNGKSHTMKLEPRANLAKVVRPGRGPPPSSASPNRNPSRRLRGAG